MSAQVFTFTPKPRPLRADVPAFDPTNDAHLRAWEAMFDAGRMAAKYKWGPA